MTPLDDNLLAALSTARPALDDQPDATSAEAQAMLARILEPGTGRRPARPRRRTLMLAGLPAAGVVAAAALVLAMTAPDPSAPGSRSSASVRTAVLDAYNQISDDIVYSTQSIQSVHAPAATQQQWAYPAMPATGHQVRVRVFASDNGAPSEDTESVYVAGPTSDFSQPAGGAGEITDVEYATRTWSRFLSSTPLLAGSLSPAPIRQQVASGIFTVAGPASVQGQPAVQLTWTMLEGPPGRQHHGVTTRLWVDAQTYVPLQVVTSSWLQPPGQPRTAFQTVTRQYRFLPPTPANLALLNPPIPAGFTRTASSPHFAPVTGGPQPRATRTTVVSG